MDNLIERMNRMADNYGDCLGSIGQNCVHEAADRITSQSAEIARLRKQAKLLEAALMEIDGLSMSQFASHPSMFSKIFEIARNALSQTGANHDAG